MENIFTEHLVWILSISSILSVVTMTIIQQIKNTNFITKDFHIWLVNFVISFLIGIPFTIYFYKLSIFDAIWTSLFTMIGAPSIYVTLKEQKIINFTPKSLENEFSKNEKNEILTEREF